MGDMGEIFNAMREQDKERRTRNLEAADPTGWTKHTGVHWSRDLAGHRLDYWPSRNKFRWKGKTYTGDVDGFIRNRQARPIMEKVEVTQADKDAAEAVIYGQKHVDLGDFYQAFARHRIEAARANDEEIARLKGALERLGSSEAMTVSFAPRDNTEGRELKARIDYARQALGVTDA